MIPYTLSQSLFWKSACDVVPPRVWKEEGGSDVRGVQPARGGATLFALVPRDGDGAAAAAERVQFSPWRSSLPRPRSYLALVLLFLS